MPGYVYILACKRKGTLYTGVTTDLITRTYQHRSNEIDGFTKRYQIHKLVYYEIFHDVRDAIDREKRLKKWRREWKIKLIEKNNPNWEDFYESLF